MDYIYISAYIDPMVRDQLLNICEMLPERFSLKNVVALTFNYFSFQIENTIVKMLENSVVKID